MMIKIENRTFVRLKRHPDINDYDYCRGGLSLSGDEVRRRRVGSKLGEPVARCSGCGRLIELVEERRKQLVVRW